jgi:SAM-dependent methyltransferase
MSNADPYDEIPYRTVAAPTTHPDRLSTIATLFGLNPAPPDRCRILEIGCGDGSNLIPMAFSFPESTVVGFDLAAQPIESGLALAAPLGLRNLTLVQKDLMMVTPEFGLFDYILCHGLYAWVPPAVQDRILAVCRANLAPGGVAYISYNTYPEGHLRVMMRELTRYLLRSVEGADRREERARFFLGQLGRSRPAAGEHGAVVAKGAARLLGLSRGALLHDDLGEEYRPAYFHEFVEHAGRHGLRFLGEAEFSSMDDGLLRPEEREALREVPGDPEVVCEQYLDFVKGRGFRQTLLCRREEPLRRPADVAALERLFVTTRARPVPVKPGSGAAGRIELQTPDGVSMKSEHPAIRRFFAALGEAWPCSVPCRELPTEGLSPEERGDFILGLTKATLIELSTLPSAFVPRPGPRPAVSRLVRLQLERGDLVTNQLHRQIRLEGELTKAIVRLLDGTRDRSGLLRELAPVDPRLTGEALEEGLRGLAGLAILTA